VEGDRDPLAEANWQQPLTLESLAQVSGMSPLALFRTFKKTRG
jgi:AraC-like DNA-binding protein